MSHIELNVTAKDKPKGDGNKGGKERLGKPAGGITADPETKKERLELETTDQPQEHK